MKLVTDQHFQAFHLKSLGKMLVNSIDRMSYWYLGQGDTSEALREAEMKTKDEKNKKKIQREENFRIYTREKNHP